MSEVWDPLTTYRFITLIHLSFITYMRGGYKRWTFSDSMDFTICSIRCVYRRKIHLWRHADIDKLKQDACTFTTSFTETFTINSSIHTMWDNIKSNLTELHEQHIPSKFTTTRFHQPWITTEIKRITRRKQRAYNRCTNKPITSREHRKYKELQKQTKELCKSAYNTYINNLISPDNSTNPKRLYSYIKNQRKDQSGIQQLQDKDGFIRSDSLTKANILNQHFQSVFTQNEDISTRQRHYPTSTHAAHNNNTNWHSQITMHTQRTQSNWTRPHTHQIT